MAHDLEAAIVGRLTALEVLVAIALGLAIRNSKDPAAAFRAAKAAPQHWLEEGFLFDDVAEVMARSTFDRVLAVVARMEGGGSKSTNGL